MEILLDHAEFCVINKPAGIGMHQEGDEPGLVRLLGEQLQQSFYPVHRLDKMTTGALLLARTAEANRVLSAQFAARTTTKRYLALSDRKPVKKQGWVKGGMEKTRNGSWKLTRGETNPAVTHFYSTSLAPGLRGFMLQPHTGRTHQLRVALKSLGCPILGDDRYGGSPADRGYLHAWRLAFDWQGERIEVTAPATEGELFAHWYTALAQWADKL
ncbi:MULTISPECIES: TIGR01621 family pseudouridine synthase [Oceanimonas]|uniref:TIGR01621 family pseudouridine synthase n=1 Tax=Oceanimonas doudoroffii TaxID=84158 RepID=A0A233RFA6_9GAMM|nr:MULTISPECIES: TIGR01621 family pseudouridine synthase [Oceanimonas]NHI01586.1 putative RNA pseudouridine synthase [Oceanimonas sp. MB9]OXY82075.1 TIGR01621 family pseudouridine synthase [Oceanimonas doudoroffii]